MLPSSLNDLFTPLELHSRRVKQEGYASMSEPPLGSTWRVPFITKNDWLDGASNTRGHIEDEDVQFFMDEVEGIHQSMENTLSSLFQNKMKMNQNNNIQNFYFKKKKKKKKKKKYLLYIHIFIIDLNIPKHFPFS
jgi:hypothetical protein